MDFSVSTPSNPKIFTNFARQTAFRGPGRGVEGGSMTVVVALCLGNIHNGKRLSTRNLGYLKSRKFQNLRQECCNGRWLMWICYLRVGGCVNIPDARWYIFA